MQKKRFSGLDELMIVNPGLPNEEQTLRLGQVFLGHDDVLYGADGLDLNEPHQGFAELYLGEDGILYRLAHFGPLGQPYLAAIKELQNPDAQYFLGEDGTLYQAI